MRVNRPSATALRVSFLRAVHQILDDKPPILDDPLSPRLLRVETIGRIESARSMQRSPALKMRRSRLVLRSRYAEDQLHKAADRGIEQFINLGAGFDTLSCRQPEWMRGFKLLELDYPATQKAKLGHFARAGLSFPANVEFRPLDLEKSDLRSALAGTAIAPERPLFVACLGVLVYLRQSSVRRLLRSVAALPRGSSIVFSYASKQALPARAVKGSVASRAAAAGEPWKTYLDAEELLALLGECGFQKAELLQPEEARDLYYGGRSDLPPPSAAYLCTATV